MFRNQSLSIVIGLMCLSLGTSDAWALDAAWRAETDARIKEIRQRDVQIRVVDAQGRSVPGAQVELKQTRQAFPFGSAMGATLLRNEKYREFFKAHFNWAVFENETKWYSNERQPGQDDYRRADAMVQWCRDNGIPVRGHCVFWAPEKWQMPWVRDLDEAELRQAVQRRLDSVVRHFRGTFLHWDINNEMLHGTFFKDGLGEDIHLWMFKRTHELDPDAKLFVNEFNILSVDQDFNDVQVDEYVAHTQNLIDQGAPIHGVGIQGHIWYEDIRAHPEVLKARLDKVAALGLPIWISEFDVADDDEQSNADKLEIVYRTAYSHPSVEGIMMWVFWAGASWRGPNAGLAKRDWTLNDAGRRYEALMDAWTTNTAGDTDTAGEFAGRGFFGDYVVTVTSATSPAIAQTFTLAPGSGTQVITVRTR